MDVGECSITKNISDEYKLTVGNKIYSVQNEIIYEHIIVNILDNTYNFTNPDSSTYESYIFSGFDKNRTNDAKYLNFAKYDDEVDKNASNHCFTRQVVSKTRNILIIEMMVIFILFAINICTYYILNKLDAKNMVRLSNIGYSKDKLLLYLSIEFIITFGFLSIGSIVGIFQNMFLHYIIEAFVVSLFIYIINIFKTFRRI